MSYHYQINNNTNEFFDSTSYMPQMQMHHGYQEFYPTDATSSMMTSAISVTSQQPTTDGSMMQTDHITYGNNWRNDWNATSLPTQQWQMGTMDHMGSHLPAGSHVDSASYRDGVCRQLPSSHCYMEPTRVLPKKSAPPPTSLIPSRPRSTPKPFRCQTCGKAFSQAANLTAHKRIHTGEKPFMCPVCNRPFSQSSSLVTHRRTHTGERPYPCAQCEKAFTDSSTLTKHLRTHTGHKPYVCSICMMKFTQSGNLHRHMKTHK